MNSHLPKVTLPYTLKHLYHPTSFYLHTLKKALQFKLHVICTYIVAIPY